MEQPLRTIDKQALSVLEAERFTGRIEIVQTPAQAEKALRFLMEQPVVGFDTETRPNFRKGDSHKVALMQLSTDSICFLIRTNRLGLFPALREFLEAESVMKIGLSTKDDFHGLRKLAAVEPRGFVELQELVKRHGIGEASLTKIYALMFGKRISKAQRLTNWEAPELTEAQQRYAALDAWACLRIYNEILKD